MQWRRRNNICRYRTGGSALASPARPDFAIGTDGVDTRGRADPRPLLTFGFAPRLARRLVHFAAWCCARLQLVIMARELDLALALVVALDNRVHLLDDVPVWPEQFQVCPLRNMYDFTLLEVPHVR